MEPLTIPARAPELKPWWAAAALVVAAGAGGGVVDGEADDDEDDDDVCDASAEAADLIAPAPDCTPPINALSGLTLDVVACPDTQTMQDKANSKKTTSMLCRCIVIEAANVDFKINTATVLEC